MFELSEQVAGGMSGNSLSKNQRKKILIVLINTILFVFVQVFS